jgi:chromosome segregation ATPase
MILKQRGDDYIMKNMSLEKTNKELSDDKEELESDLKNSRLEFENLRDKFRYLGENHETLIRIKDEYKEKVSVLERENRMMSEKLRVTRVLGETNDEDRKRLEKCLESAEMRFSQAEEARLALENQSNKLNSVVSEREVELKVARKEIDDLRSKNVELEKTNKGFFLLNLRGF